MLPNNPAWLAEYISFLGPLLHGAVLTLSISAVAAVGAVSVGLIVCAGRLSENRIVSRITRGYISLIRGTPLLLQLFYIYYALPEIGIVLPAFTAGAIGLSLNFGAYLAELFRAGVQSVGRGQTEAAAALGLHSFSRFRLVVAPQALRVILPALGNYALVLIKDSSLVAVLSVLELMRAGELLANATFKALPIYTMVGAIYFIICVVVAKAFERAERKLQIPSR
ncbi:MAG: amino acid ABC transporter permease [Rhizobiales bacterium]|nr:amino acid ABC transporter permease [Hyphomicrobiales bacterium]